MKISKSTLFASKSENVLNDGTTSISWQLKSNIPQRLVPLLGFKKGDRLACLLARKVGDKIEVALPQGVTLPQFKSGLLMIPFIHFKQTTEEPAEPSTDKQEQPPETPEVPVIMKPRRVQKPVAKAPVITKAPTPRPVVKVVKPVEEPPKKEPEQQITEAILPSIAESLSQRASAPVPMMPDIERASEKETIEENFEGEGEESEELVDIESAEPTTDEGAVQLLKQVAKKERDERKKVKHEQEETGVEEGEDEVSEEEEGSESMDEALGRI